MVQAVSDIELIKMYRVYDKFFIKAKLKNKNKWYEYDRDICVFKEIKYLEYKNFTYKYTGEEIQNRKLMLEIEDFIELCYDRIFSY